MSNARFRGLGHVFSFTLGQMVKSRANIVSAVILLDQALPTEELVQQLEALRVDMENPAALYLTEKILLQLETQTQQDRKWEQKQKELQTRQTEAQNALAAARRNRQEAERRYRENPY